jgi:hypothetical protein
LRARLRRDKAAANDRYTSGPNDPFPGGN